MISPQTGDSFHVLAPGIVRFSNWMIPIAGRGETRKILA
jgi:hypothetical protein